MRLPRLAIQNHQFTIVIVTLLIALGAVSFLTMPRSEDPAVHPAGASAYIIYPGATPLDIEELILSPLEEVINEIDDIKQMNSLAESGIGIINTEFESGSDADEKYAEFVQKVNSVSNALPQGILRLELVQWSLAEVNVLQLALISDSESYRHLQLKAEDLKKDIEKTTGVRRVDIVAVPQQQVRVSLKLEKMAAFQLSLDQIMGGIVAANQNIPGGYLDVGSKRFNIQTSGSFESLQQIKNTIIHAGNGKVLYLKDVADIAFAYEDEKYRARVDNETAIFITVQQKEATNIFKVLNAVKNKVSTFEKNLPNTMRLEYVFDQSTSVADRLNSFFTNLLQGLILVGIVVLLAVGFRAAGIVIIVIPFSILIGIGFIDLSGYGLQQMSIAGLVIALGLLVDNAIVVTENIARFMRLGHNRVDAAAKGTSQVGWAIVSATMTTVLAFVPMMLIQNVTGDFIRSMPLTVVFTLLASLFLSLTFTPYLSSKFLNVEKTGKRRARQAMNNFVTRYYRPTLDYALRKPGCIIIIAVLVFISSMALFPLVGVSFFPKAEKPQIIIDINTPSGTNLDKTDKVARDVEKALTQFDNIQHVITNVGHGNPRIYYNLIPMQDRSTHAQLFIQMQSFDEGEFYKILNKLRNDFKNYPGAKIKVKELEQGPPVEAPIAIRIMGDNLKVLENISKNVEDIFFSTIGTVNVNNPLSTSKTDLFININREKAGMLGVPIAEVDKAIRAGIAGLTVSHYRDSEGKEYDIVIRLPFTGKPTLEAFSHIYVTSYSGASIPLKSLATLEFKGTPMQIDHHNLERTVTITADVLDGYVVDSVTQAILEKLEQYDLPSGYRFSIGGELESREESFGGMLQAIIIALIGIFAVLVLQFKSYTQPIIVFSAIPLAFIGSILALLIAGKSFSFTAFIGLTSLVGIVVNNSIILVDYANQLRAGGKDVIAALKESGETRFIPIILTTATTIGGLLPLTLTSGNLFAPLGWTIIGGLLVSTILTLIVVPVLYKLLAKA